MVDILICEDNKVQRERLEKIIYSVIDKYEFDMDILVSSEDSSSIIDYASKNKINNKLYFFDVELKNNINGIEKASEIRKIDSDGMIVFVTSHAEMSLLTFEYKVQASDYIVKDSDNFESRVEECLINANKTYNKLCDDDHEYIFIQKSEKIQKVKINDILFIETANDHRIRIHILDGIIEVYGTIKEYEEKLPSHFIKAHRSYLVNTINIKNINKDKKIIEMINGEECLVSRLCMKDVLKCVK